MSTAETRPLTRPDGFEPAGVGLNVYESPQPVEGTAKWLESPEDVIAFAESGEDVSDVIVIARGGATTFLTMALNAGVRGVITLQGAPESHLGILSREYGIPCLMSVAFEKGIRTSRGETIPADGVRLRMDVSARPKGTVSVETGAPADDSPAAETGPAMSPKQLAQIQLLLEKYLGEVPHGTAGNDIMLARQETPVLDLDAPARGELIAAEVNDFLHYLAWNEWDALAARATEGESGLIPRQEYEAVGILNCWFKHPEWMAAIQDRVGEDGIIEIAARARTEIGTKINLLHNWALAAAPSFGRGIALELKLHDFPYRTDRITQTMSTVRRLYQGLWGGGPVFSSMRDYRAPVLDKSWIARFEADRISLADSGARLTFQRFNGAVELLGFLVHFDNRLGLGDSGPYPTDDGGFVIVRDLFINEPAFPWSDSTQGLPYAVSIALFFAGGTGLRTQVTDLSTLFTEPANYLPYVTGIAVYAREQFDTPADQLRRLSLDDMTRLRAEAEAKSEVLYRRIAAMSKREKVLAGTLVYTSGFALPFARAAGMHEELVRDYGFNEVHPVVEACYDTIVSGVATEMIPRLFLTGSWANDVPAESREAALTGPGEFDVLQAIRCRGVATSERIAASTGLAADAVEAAVAAAEEAGFVKRRQGKVSGVSLTPTGRARLVLLTRDLVASEQLAALAAAYDAFVRPNQELKSLVTAWQADQDVTAALAALEPVHADVTQVIVQAATAQPRFRRYQPRLGQALESFRGGDAGALARPLSESYHDVWMELHEDLLTTLGRTRGDADG
jgi:DNA-binding MarR family transcriptional regulator